MAYLALVRHGMSEYNKQGLWTGWDDPVLTPEGIEQAKKAGEALKDIQFDFAFTSILTRAKQTLEEIKKVTGQQNLFTTEDKALNERNYGDYTRKNKWQVKEQIGEDEFTKLRRSWDYPIPNGESLKQVYERETPYFEHEILPKVKGGKNVIIVSSGNALRCIAKYLERIEDDKIAAFEIGVGEVLLYGLDVLGNITAKERRNVSEVSV
jgi:2,3-bisphosphoglycerate-dependent phosphoglycerate mutase